MKSSNAQKLVQASLDRLVDEFNSKLNIMFKELGYLLGSNQRERARDLEKDIEDHKAAIRQLKRSLPNVIL